MNFAIDLVEIPENDTYEVNISLPMNGYKEFSTIYWLKTI